MSRFPKLKLIKAKIKIELSGCTKYDLTKFSPDYIFQKSKSKFISIKFRQHLSSVAAEEDDLQKFHWANLSEVNIARTDLS